MSGDERVESLIQEIVKFAPAKKQFDDAVNALRDFLFEKHCHVGYKDVSKCTPYCEWKISKTCEFFKRYKDLKEKLNAQGIELRFDWGESLT